MAPYVATLLTLSMAQVDQCATEMIHSNTFRNALFPSLGNPSTFSLWPTSSLGNSTSSPLEAVRTSSAANSIKDRSAVNHLFFPRDNTDSSYTMGSFPGELAWIPRDPDHPD